MPTSCEENSYSAFVGFSFTKEDKEIKTKFIDNLNTIKKAIPGFSWESAESAEPRELKTKVLNKMKDKKIFIGLCTVKEIVVEKEKIQQAPLWLCGKGKQIVEESDCHKKTSDWLIQEIGVAIGLGMEIILLVEEGLNRFGELQGNIERIEFSRDNFDASLKKLLETVSSLSPSINPSKINTINQEAAMVRESKDNENKERENNLSEKEIDGLTSPSEEWEFDKYFDSLTLAIGHCNSEKIENIIKSLKNSSKVEKKQKVFLEAYKLYLENLLNKTDTVVELEILANENLDNLEAVNQLILLFKHQKQLDQAICWIDKACKDIDNDNLKFNLILKSAEIAFDMGKREDAQRRLLLLEKMNDLSRDKRMSILQTRSEVAQKDGENHTFCFLAEKIIQENPENDQLRFSLAYCYNDIGNYPMSLKHYNALIFNNKLDPSTNFNNIGVLFNNLELIGKAVTAYNESIELGGTLATSNLAHLLIRVGFFKEAESLCKQALRDYPLCDIRVNEALVKLDKQKKIEIEKEKSTEKEAFDISQKMQDLGRGMLQTKLPDGKYELLRDKKTGLLNIEGYKASGEFQEKYKNEFRFVQTKEDTRTMTIKGEVIGYTIVFSEKSDLSLLHKENGIIAFSNALDSAEIAYFSDIKIVEEYDLKRC